MPHKANAGRRHHIHRPKRRITNWAEYDAALRRRGSLTVWFTDEAIASWRAAPRTTPGGQPSYSHLAITTPLLWRLQTGSFLLALAYPVVWLFFCKKELAAQKRRLDGIWERREAARLARLHAQQEAMFYNYGASAQHVAYGPGGMTINVKTPVTWSEWLRRSYWIWRWIWLLVPAIWLVGGIEPFMQMIAAAIPDVLKVRLNELLEWLQAFLKA